ncbi:MAG: NAD-binding protein [Mycobacteriaceae bacterium]|nr:NAD-binding protein [Mycobacteriaceae bacterium]
MSEKVDVVVVGAGPVGLMLACELAAAGVEVLVVERLVHIDPTVKAGAINVPTAQAFYRRGLLPRLLAEQDATRAKLAEFMAAKGIPAPPQDRLPFAGHFAGVMIDASVIDLDDPAFADVGPAASVIMVSQQQIEAILGERAAELGVTVRRGVTVTGFDADGHGVAVHVEACGDSASRHTVHADWLVGCDGGRSLVRKVAGFEFPGLDPEITGRQVVAEMTDAEGLRPGWNRTDTGIYAHGPWPGRFLTVELDGPPADRDAPVTAAEVQESLRRVSGVPVTVTKVISATRFTDNTRQATTYRKGRVLLAGDAAHVHSPFGGQGLNLGVGDAVNLGWKLAATVRGWAPAGLLDTYTTERYPIGEWVLEWTRAQIAAMRTDQRSVALRGVLTDLLATPAGATYVLKQISGVLHRYHPGDHELIGAAAPDLALADGTRLGEHGADGRAVLLDAADSPVLRTAAAPWSDRVRIVTAKPADPRTFTALLVRPDGYVAWASDTPAPTGLTAALARWFGAPR